MIPLLKLQKTTLKFQKTEQHLSPIQPRTHNHRLPPLLEKGPITNLNIHYAVILVQYLLSSLALMGGCWLPVVSGAYLTVANKLTYLNQGAEKVVKIWSPETGEFLRNLIGHTQGLSDIAWSFDSVYLASASDDTTIRIWNVENVRPPTFFVVEFLTRMKGLTHKLLKGHTKWVFCLNYNPASNLLVSGGCEGDVRIWNVARGKFVFILCPQPCAHVCLLGKCMKTLHAHLDYVTAVHFNRDATLIVSCALDGLMCVSASYFLDYF